METIDVQKWVQLRYGKHVQEENGPIVKGSEHKTTGASKSLDVSLYTQMTPDSTGIGTNDRTDWREYTWLDDGGGIVTRIHSHNNELLIIAGRICGRTESGKRLGRMYTEGHYACLPVSQHQFPTTLGLLQALHTTPQLQSSNFTLPLLDVESVSISLPENWIDLISPVLKVLLSGIPLSIKTTKRSLQELTAFVHIVQSCLPNTLAWRLTTKIGAIECPPSDAVLSVVQSCNFDMPRMIGFSMVDAEKNHQKIKSTDHATTHPLIEGETIGLRYIEYLQEHCLQCKTTIELQTQIHKDFPKLKQWNHFPIEQSLYEASIGFLQILFEDDGLAQLQTALQKGSAVPSLKVFFHRKLEALISLLHHVWDHPSVILESLNIWGDIWDELFDQCPMPLEGIVNLLHPRGSVTKAAFALFEEAIPEDFHDLIYDKLQSWNKQLTQQNSPNSLWLEFVNRYNEYAPWIQRWIHERQTEFSLRMRYVYNLNTPLDGLPFTHWLHEMSTQSVKKNFDEKTFSIARLIDDQSYHIQVAFIEELYTYSPLITIKEALKLSGFATTTYRTDQHILANIIYWKDRTPFWMESASRLLVEFAEAHCKPTYSSPLFEHILMHTFSTLSVEQQDTFWPFFSTKIGNTIAQWMFNRSSDQTAGPFDSFYINQFPELYQQGHTTLQKIFVEVATDSSLPHHSTLIAICKNILRQETHCHPLPSALKQIQQKRLQTIQDLMPKWISFWLSHLPFTIHLSDIEHDDTLCAFFFSMQPSFQPPSPTLLERLLSESMGKSVTWKHWCEMLVNQQWDTKPGWRLLFMEHVPDRPLYKLEDHEKHLFQHARLELKAHFVYLGFIIESSLLNTFTVAEFNRLKFDYQAMLIWWSVHFDHTEILLLVLPAYLQTLTVPELKEFKSEVSSTFSIFSSLVQKVNNYFESEPSTLPTILEPSVWLKRYLLSLPKPERIQWVETNL